MAHKEKIIDPSDTSLKEELGGFSYSYAGDAWWRKQVTRIIEIASGQPYFVRLYLFYRANKRTGENFFDAAVRLLRFDVKYDEARLEAWPKAGPLVVISNHPFGVADGLIACQLAARARGDFKILIISVLDLAEEIRPFMLPIDFSETRAAMKTNFASRAAALDYLKKGGCIVVFPAGGVATTPKLFALTAVDAPWKNFAARLVLEARASVAPVYFPGQNSMLFQIFSHLSMTLRMALYFREARRRVGKRIEARLGPVIPCDALETRDRTEALRKLRTALFELAGPKARDT
jgi:putative hemolysin